MPSDLQYEQEANTVSATTMVGSHSSSSQSPGYPFYQYPIRDEYSYATQYAASPYGAHPRYMDSGRNSSDSNTSSGSGNGGNSANGGSNSSHRSGTQGNGDSSKGKKRSNPNAYTETEKAKISRKKGKSRE